MAVNDTWGASWLATWLLSWTKETIVIDEAGVEQTLGRFTSSVTTGLVTQAETMGRFVDSDTTGRFKP